MEIVFDRTSQELRISYSRAEWDHVSARARYLEIWSELELVRLTESADEVQLDLLPSAWNALAPPQLNQLRDETDDSLIVALEHLNQVVPCASTELELDTHGYMGTEGFSFVIRTRGREVLASSDQVIATLMQTNQGPITPAVLALVLYLKSSQSDRNTPAHAIGNVKAALRTAPQLFTNIRLSKYLETVKAQIVRTLAPVWTEKNGAYSLQYDATVVDAGAGTEVRVRLSSSDLIGESPLLNLGSGQHVLLDAPQHAVLGRARGRLKNLPPKEAASAAQDPANLVPHGVHCESLDLSEYNPRVKGFEVIQLGRMEILPSNITWYRSDETPSSGFKVTVVGADGESHELNFGTSAEVRTALFAIDQESRRFHTDPDRIPQPINVGGKLISPTAHLREALQRIESVTKEKPASNDVPAARSKKATAAAVIGENGPQEREIRTGVAWGLSELRKLLKPDVEIYPHQAEGIEWLLRHYRSNYGGVLVADDMGLGKTFQLLSLIVGLTEFGPSTGRPHLVVAPLILLENWAKNYAKFFKASALGEPLILHGSELKRHTLPSGTLDLQRLSQARLIITNYATLSAWQRDFLRMSLGVVVFDESQGIKNPDTAQARAARGVKADFVVCSTGTPVETRLRDLWTQIDACQRAPYHPLGRLSEFQKDYEKSDSGIDLARKNLGYPGPDAILIRREKSVLRDLPTKSIRMVQLPITPEQSGLESAIIRGNAKLPLKILQNLQKLYQHPALLNDQEVTKFSDESVRQWTNESPKLSWTIEQLKTIRAANEKVLIFTLWTKMQDILAETLERHFGISVPIINGTTMRGGVDYADRIIDKFSSREGFGVLVLSPLVAGAGLDITAANHVIHYGRWWNPAKEDQASDRAYRIGQTRPVTVYYPVLHAPNDSTSGFDIKLHNLVESRREQARNFLAPVGASELNGEDLTTIFGEATT